MQREFATRMNRGRLNLDQAAICLSGLCLIHCLALPILAALLPVLAQVSEAEWLHRAFVLLAVPVTLLAITQRARMETRSHARFAVAALSGLLLLTIAAFMEVLHDHETLLTTLGGLILGAAHLWRWRQTRCQHPKVMSPNAS